MLPPRNMKSASVCFLTAAQAASLIEVTHSKECGISSLPHTADIKSLPGPVKMPGFRDVKKETKINHVRSFCDIMKQKSEKKKLTTNWLHKCVHPSWFGNFFYSTLP